LESLLQQAPFDGGGSRDHIGTLAAYVPLRAGLEDVDCAIARLEVEHASSIPYIGSVTQCQQSRTGMAVRKFGRTTGLTSGEVAMIGAVMNFQTPDGSLLLRNLMGIRPDSPSGFSDRGDSGSLIVDADTQGVGLLVGGSTDYTFACELRSVLDRLRVTLA
jgi:hypothetical protein